MKKIKWIMLRIAEVIEHVIAAALLIMTLLLFLLYLRELIARPFGEITINDIATQCFSFIIALEFARMLLYHSTASIVEVIMFSVARGMIVEHQSPSETLLMIAAIALLFFTRKYLITEEAEKEFRRLRKGKKKKGAKTEKDGKEGQEADDEFEDVSGEMK